MKRITLQDHFLYACPRRERSNRLSAIELPILAGVFEDEAQALRALEKLQKAGFNDEQLGMVMRNGRLLPVWILDTLISIGVPEEEAGIYQSELDAGHVLLLVRHRGRILEAFRCMFEITVPDRYSPSQNQAEVAPNSSKLTSFEPSSSYQDDHSLRKLLKKANLDHLL
jgi:hypothetical protein